MATILDIAKKVNLSKTLVARALNGEPGVSQKSREKILKTANDLNYRPNIIAKTLNTNKTNCIGIMLDSLCDTLYFDMIKSIQESAMAKGFKAIFCSISDEDEIKKHYVDYFTQGICDGVIIYGSKIDDLAYIHRLAKSNFPLVVIENEIASKDVNNILVDNVYGGYAATEYLIKLGHKKIYHFLGDMNKNASIDRQIGYLNAMKQANLNKYIRCIETDFAEISGYENMKDLIKEEDIPEGIFFAGDLTAYGAIRAIFEYRPELINKIRLIGFDEDRRPNFNIPYPSLSTVRQPISKLGEIATNILLDQIINKNNSIYIKTLRPELIIKET